MTGDQADEPTAYESIHRRLNTGVAHPTRVYDALLGGKDNFAADRELAESMKQAAPKLGQAVRAHRAFLERTVTYLAGEAGIRQFLDIGTGLPAGNNTHEVAQRIAPEARVVYVDNDPIVLLHARALLTSAGPGKTDYIEADLREPHKVLSGAAGLLDFSQPVAIMLLGILHFIGDEDDPHGIVRILLDAVPSGSYLAVTSLGADPQMAEGARRYNEQAENTKASLRDHAAAVRFFDGLEILEPGVVPPPKWRPHSELEAAAYFPGWGGVGRKP